MDRIKILIYIPQRLDTLSIHHELTTSLAYMLSEMADVDLLTSLKNVDDAFLSSFQIIHIFGCWYSSGIRLQFRAHQLHIPTVITPLGGLQPWEQKSQRAKRTYSKQKKAIKQASAIHLCGKLEQDLFVHLGWNSRFAQIKNPVISSLILLPEMRDKMMELYQKILDTQARLMLTDTEQDVILKLMQIGLNPDTTASSSPIEELRQVLEKFGHTEWKRILFYASDEHIDDLLRKGLADIQFTAPSIVMDNIHRFELKQHYPEGQLPTDKLSFKSYMLNGKIRENIKEKEVNEKKCCLALLNLRHALSAQQAPMSYLADIYRICHYLDMDEDRLNEIVKELKIDDFASSLMFTLQELLGLSEGFMPFKVKDNHHARELTKQLTKFNTWA